MFQFNNLKVLGFNLQPKFYGIIKFILNEYQRTGRPLSVGITSFLDIQKNTHVITGIDSAGKYYFKLHIIRN